MTDSAGREVTDSFALVDRWIVAHTDLLSQWRRHIHAHPELARQEFATTAFVVEQLEAAGLVPKLLPGGTGLICDIGPSGPRVALRADMDALPLQEFTGAAAQSAQRMAIETADGWSKDDLDHAWVNAQGVVVQVEFDDKLFAAASSAEAAAAVVQAAQAAAARAPSAGSTVKASPARRKTMPKMMPILTSVSPPPWKTEPV